MSGVYYNDNDKNSAAWLRELIRHKLIPDGDVDDRSIKDVQPSELVRYHQCHFFAGIGGWAYALILANWPKERPVWTGSCPCQPFSAAGSSDGVLDERHLWPDFRRLISERRPATIFGEQVASKDGRYWLAGVRLDLEALGYAIGGADLCAAGVGAPQPRQRLYWVADSNERSNIGGEPQLHQPSGANGVQEHNGMADPEVSERGRSGGEANAGRGAEEAGRPSASSGLVNSDNPRSQGRDGEKLRECSGQQIAWPGGSRFWDTAIWHQCLDGKARRIPAEPALFPLADGIPGRVGLLRGAGNSIVPQVAAEFVRACMEIL